MENTDSETTSQKNESSDVDWHGLTTKHLEFYEEKIKSVDASMTSLAYTLDAMHAAVMKDYQGSKKSSSTESAKHHEMDDLTLKLLLKIERTVLHDQECAVNSLRDFLHFTWECITLFNKTKINDSREFSLDTYVSTPKETRQNRPELEMITEEAIVENARLKEDIERFYKHEKKFDAEKRTMSVKTKNLEKLNDHLRSQNEEKDGNIAELKSQLCNLKGNNIARQQLSEDLENVKRLNDKLNKRILDLECETSMMLNSISEKNKNIESYKSEHSEKDCKIEKLNKELSQLEKECDSIKAERKRGNKELKELMTKQRDEIDKQTTEKLDKLENENQQLLETTKQHVTQLEFREKKIGTANAEIDSLNAKVKEINDLNKQMHSDLENLKQEHLLVKENFETASKTLEQLQIDLKSKEQEIKSLQSMLEEAELSKSKIVSLSTENKDIKRRNEQVRKNLEKSMLENECLENDLKEKIRDLDSLQKQIRNEKEENHRLLTENVDLSSKHKQVQKRLDETMKECESLQQQVENGIIEIKRLEKEGAESSFQLQKLEKEREDVDEQLSTTTQETLKLKERMSKTISQLEQSNESLKKENSSLKQELEIFMRKKVIQVQIYYQRRSGLIEAVEEELLCLLKSKMEVDGKVELEFIKRLQAADVNPNTPLLLLCVSASRIGTDAANTIHGLNLTSNTWLLIFHHKDVHALPSQASYQVLTGKEYAALGGICDLAFLTGKGLYSCPMNESSIDKIVNFIDASVSSSDENS